MSDLPGAIHLISQIPQPDIVRLLITILNPQITPVSAGRKIAVLHQIPGGVRSPGSQIYRHHHIRACPAAPFTEFIRAHLVVFHGKPGEFRTLRPFILRPDSVLPIVSGNKITARITYNRHLQFPGQFNDIPAESAVVCKRMAGIINASVNRSADMLDERSVNPLVNFPDLKIPVQFHDSLSRIPLVLLCLILFHVLSSSMKFLILSLPLTLT